MEIKTEGGIAKPMPLTELQRYDKAIKIIKIGLVVGGFLGFWALAILTFVVWKVLYTGAVNTYIARCGG